MNITVETVNQSISDAIKEALSIIANNTPMCDSEKLPYGPIADELDKARDHLRKALLMVKEAV